MIGIDDSPQNKTCPKPGFASSATNQIGAVVSAAAYLAGKLLGTNPQIQAGPNSIRITNSPINFGNRAVTIGNFEIFTRQQTPSGSQPSYTGAIVNNGRHEDAHSYQATELGDLYLPSLIVGGLLNGDKNPYEVAADQHALGKCP